MTQYGSAAGPSELSFSLDNADEPSHAYRHFAICSSFSHVLRSFALISTQTSDTWPSAPEMHCSMANLLSCRAPDNKAGPSSWWQWLRQCSFRAPFRPRSWRIGGGLCGNTSELRAHEVLLICLSGRLLDFLVDDLPEASQSISTCGTFI